MQNMTKLLSTFIVIITLSTVIFSCGAPQPIYGQAYADLFGFRRPLGNTRIELRYGGQKTVEAVVITNPFGYYRFDGLMPCNAWSVRASRKRTVFIEPSIIVWLPDSGKGLQVDFEGGN